MVRCQFHDAPEWALEWGSLVVTPPIHPVKPLRAHTSEPSTEGKGPYSGTMQLDKSYSSLDLEMRKVIQSQLDEHSLSLQMLDGGRVLVTPSWLERRGHRDFLSQCVFQCLGYNIFHVTDDFP